MNLGIVVSCKSRALCHPRTVVLEQNEIVTPAELATYVQYSW